MNTAPTPSILFWNKNANLYNNSNGLTSISPSEGNTGAAPQAKGNHN